jgi:hypothetical protein
MTTQASSQALNPSDYVAQHLQNFASSPSPSMTAGQHVRFFVWNDQVVVVAAILFIVLACMAAFRDRWALFTLNRGLSFGQRLYVWWSCAWRQWLASTLLLVVGVIAFHFVVGRAAIPLMKFAEDLISPGTARSSPVWSAVIAAMPAIVAILVYLLLSLPLAGYMVRSGLLAHDLPAPQHFGFWHATVLGLTTYVWSLPGSLAIANVGGELPHHAADLLRAILLVVWGMYIVLPRQVRRVVRLAESAY